MVLKYSLSGEKYRFIGQLYLLVNDICGVFPQL